MMQQIHWRLLAALADGKPHHITELSALLGSAPLQLNNLWQHTPPFIHRLLHQENGNWRLRLPLAVWNEDRLASQAAAVGWQAMLLNEHPSSNTYLIEAAKRLPESRETHRRAVFVHSQTAGRGRQGKPWASRIGASLTFSTAWHFRLPQNRLGGLAIATAVACCRALMSQDIPISIKWPNDLLVHDRKLGGILIETLPRQTQTAAVIGIGLNWLPPENHTAAALHEYLPHTIPTELAAPLLSELAAAFETYENEGLTPFMTEFHRLHRHQNRNVSLSTAGRPVLEGRALGIDTNGALILQDAENTQHHIVSGDISLQGTEGHGENHPCLLLDAGNSKLKWAWSHDGNSLHHFGKAPYWNLSALSEAWETLGGIDVRIIGSAVCGSAKQAAVAAAIGRTPEWQESTAEALGIRNHYRNPEEHGADRWFNVLGSRLFTQRACVIVSCGTAVTIDALSTENQYLGGSILPGFNLMKEALARHTAHLNRPVGRPYPFGTTTANAIAGGMSDAVSGAVLIMHQRLQARTRDTPVDIIITGGGAHKVLNGLPEAFVLDKQIQIVDNLVLYGLLNWARHTPRNTRTHQQ